MKIINSIICLLFGHKPRRMLVENEFSIYTRGCCRCKCGLGFPEIWKGISKIPPPGYTSEQIKVYEKYVEQKMQDVRDSVSF